MFLFSPVIRIFWQGRWPDGHIEPRRRLFDCELVYTSAGAFQLDINRTMHRMRAGSFAIIPPGVWHESRVSAGGFAVRHCVHFDWLPRPEARQIPIASFPGESFDLKLVSTIPPEIARHLPLVSHFDPHDPVSVVFRGACGYFAHADSAAPSMLWPVLNLLLTACSSQDSKSPPLARNTQAALRIRDYIDANFAKPQDYNTYRKLSGLSTSHLCQLFATVFGRPPSSYLLNLRLQHACRLLHETELSVKEVGHAVGIPDPNYFSRLFRKHFGQCPSAFQSMPQRHT